jgi:serine/threonine protein kinase
MPILDVGAGKTRLVTTHYRATEFLQEGRFAEVYRAHYKRDGIDVALKVYKEPVTAGKTDDRARKECALLKKLADLEFFPARPSFFPDHFDRKKYHIVVMELGEYRWEEIEEGEGPEEDRKRWRKAIVPLSSVLPTANSVAQPEQSRPEFWRPEALAEWVGNLCQAVALMHERGVLHLDLKPDNILLKRAAGESSVPFLVDFNTSIGAHGEPFSGGTAGYRAPEVKTGARTTPDRADDLYALALVLWEMHFGLGSRDKLIAAAQPHALVPYSVDSLRRVLLRALAREASQRYPTAAEFKLAVAACLRTPSGLSDQEMAYIRQETVELRETFEEFLGGQYYLHVSKAKREEVASLFSNLSTESTDSQDLKDRLLQLGPKAIPAVFAEGYKLNPDSPHFSIVVDALAELGRGEQERLRQRIQPGLNDRALSSIDQYCLSSTYAVRRLCRELCLRLQVLPSIIRESLLTDLMIYLPGERDELADLIIRLGDTPDDLLSLLRYLYAEYVEDYGVENYNDLRGRVAYRVGEMSVPDKAILLTQQASAHAWADLEHFRTVSATTQEDLARGLLQLIGDAFGSLGDEALGALQHGRVPPWCKNNRWPIWRTFTWKLCQRHHTAATWLQGLSSPPPGVSMKQVQEVLDRLGPKATPTVDLQRLFEDYLSTGHRNPLNRLVFSHRLGEVLALAAQAMRTPASPVTVGRTLELLRYCGGKERSTVLTIAFAHYEAFATVNYGQLLQVVCQNGLPAVWMHKKATEQLEKDSVRPERSSLAQEWLDLLYARE